MSRPIIALDADGVLLDYHLAYARAWERAFGVFPRERDPQAYWPMDRWEVERVTGARLQRLRESFGEPFWATVPALPGAVQACHALRDAGYELVCVTALPPRFAQARQDNLRALGFPIEVVHATDHHDGERSPKADVLQAIGPVAFVDDYLPYLAGVHEDIHAALIMRGPSGTPNLADQPRAPDSRHADLASFARWWVAAARV